MEDLFYEHPVFTVILLMFGTFGISIILAYFVESKSCYEKYTEYKPTYGFFEGCRIDYNGKQTPTDIIRNVNLN